MRWNCPHCGVNLAVTDDKLGTGWSFSRCYKCGGFALIRRAEVNLVKVDRAPVGEHIVLPEGSEEPAMLSEEATENLARLRRESALRASLRAPAEQKDLPMPPAPAPAPAAAAPTLPPPLPEQPRRSSLFQRILPAAITLAAVTTVTSGIYLYLQGQELWQKSRATPAAISHPENAATAAAVSAPAHSQIRPAAYEGQDLVPAPSIASRAMRAEGSDQLHQNAMAPVRDEQSETGAAPEQAKNPPAPSIPAVLQVLPKGKNADLHTGPGSLYPLIGMADPKQALLVTDWSDRWFKVALPEGKKLPKYGWIRTDLVQVVQTPQTQSAASDF